MRGDSVAASDVQQWGQQFLEQARGVDYLTEIALSREELDNLLAALRPLWNCRTSAEVDFALAVAAINFAFYQDRDEGLREPFLDTLRDGSDVNVWQKYIGPRIRDAIERSGHAVPDNGFRYVGPVRLHAGLSFSRLPAYARLVDDLADDPGWNAVRTCPRDVLRQAVHRHFAGSAVAEEFLLRPQGIDFLRDTCDVLAAFRAGLLTRDELGSRPGFRSGFLTRLAELINARTTTDVATSARAAAPRLMLDEASLRLFLRFDANLVSRRALVCDQLRGRLLRPRMYLGADVPYASSYTGTRTGTDPATSRPMSIPWEVEAWRPVRAGWALFDVNGAFVVSGAGDGKHEAEVQPGTYTAVADVTLHLGRHDAAVELGRLNTGGQRLDGEFAVYHCDLANPSALLPGARSVPRLCRVPRLEAKSTQAWARLSDLDAVWSDEAEPALRLYDWTPEAAARFRLVVELHGREEPLSVPFAQEGRPVDVPLRQLSTPSSGRICLWPVSRWRGGAMPVELTWARLGRCAVTAPDELFEETATPMFAVDSPADAEVEFDATVVETAEERGCRRTTYRATAGWDRHQGRLRQGDEEVALYVPVYRARFCDCRRPLQATMLTSGDLRDLHRAELAGAPASFEIHGRPHAETSLLLRHIDGRAAELSRKQLSPAGTGMLAVNEILDGLQACDDWIGTFGLTDGGRRSFVTSGSWFIGKAFDFDSVHPEHIPLLPLPAQGALALIGAARDNSADTDAWAVDLRNVRPSRLAQRAARFAAAAATLDGRPSPPGLQSVLDPQFFAELSRVRQLLQLIDAIDAQPDPTAAAREATAQFDELDARGWLARLTLDVPRWQLLLADARECAAGRADAAGRVAKLVDVIRKGVSASPDVPTMLEQGLRNLALAETAPVASQSRFLKQATEQLVGAAAVREGRFWGAIAASVLPLVYLRQCRIAYALRMMERRCDEGAPRALECLMVRNLRMNHAAIQKPTATAAPDFTLVSPRNDDASLAAALIEPLKWRDAGERCWLTAWLGWRYHCLSGAAAGDGTREALRAAALRQSDRIPSSLERPVVLKELQADAPTAWDARGVS